MHRLLNDFFLSCNVIFCILPINGDCDIQTLDVERKYDFFFKAN